MQNKLFQVTYIIKIVLYTGVARNFDWKGPKMEKSCDVSFVTFFGDVIMMTLLK